MAWSLPSDAICTAAYEGHTLTHDATSAVEGRHRAGEKSPPDSGDLRGYPDRVPPSPARPGLIDRHDLVAAVDHAAEKKMTIISAPAGSGRPRCCARGPAVWVRAADRLHVGVARPA